MSMTLTVLAIFTLGLSLIVMSIHIMPAQKIRNTRKLWKKFETQTFTDWPTVWWLKYILLLFISFVEFI